MNADAGGAAESADTTPVAPAQSDTAPSPVCPHGRGADARMQAADEGGRGDGADRNVRDGASPGNLGRAGERRAAQDGDRKGEFSDYEVRGLLRDMVGEILEKRHSIVDGTWEPPTIESRLPPGRALAQERLVRAERYLWGGAAAVVELIYVVRGDGREAQFANFVQSNDPKALATTDRFGKLSYDITATFLDAEERLEQTPDAEVMRYFERRYEEVMPFDETTSLTREPVHAYRIGSNSEGAAEGAGHTHYAANAIDKARAEGRVTSKDDIREIVFQSLATGAMARSGLDVVDFRGHSQTTLDYDKIRLVVRHEKSDDPRYLLDMGGQSGYLPESHEWLSKNQRPPVVIKCLARLGKLDPDDKYDALYNFMFAVTNKALDSGLYDPGVASEAWRRRKDDTAKGIQRVI